ncbi:sigma-70 family RNA polymerase sigma factor [Desertivirga xinjiangensis]|uniref:sigma-70 family RNA polymerase sigma factor n=1 Tax=Desertivirga xinjiangensis TaxID=539206 RepID=UPI00210B760E|nr:sigma-70 family RNA polymerase sigma factor [Pedobacter xinjiangensis]
MELCGDIMGENVDLVNFELLYNRWSGLLHQYAFYIVRDEEVAGSLVNDLFVQLWFKQTKPENLKGYLFRAIKNASINYLATRQNYPLTLLDQEELTTISDLSSISPESDHADKLSMLQNLISQLPQKRQLVFRMHRIEGFSYAEIAELLQISVRTVEDHLSKAMQFIHTHSKPFLCRKLTEA